MNGFAHVKSALRDAPLLEGKGFRLGSEMSVSEGKRALTHD